MEIWPYQEFARVLNFPPSGVLKSYAYISQINIQILWRKKCILVSMADPGSKLTTALAIRGNHGNDSVGVEAAVVAF